MSENTYQNAVKSIQKYLRQINHKVGSINRIPIDGIYGEDTRNGIIDFQKSNGIPETGIVDLITWGLLYSAYLKSIEKNSSSDGIYPFFDTQSDYEIKIGDNNTLVQILEIILEEISTEYIETENTFERNGVFDQRKSDIIYEYQKTNLLPTNGRVDKTTWNRLASDFNSILRKNM